MYLLDTNFLSELKRPSPNNRVLTFLDSVTEDDLYVSTVTLAELRYGVELGANSPRGQDLGLWLSGTVRPMFPGRILQVTEDVIVRWRYLVETGRKAGRTFSQPDLFLAATALEHNLTLVTRNVRDFTGIDLRILNPWEELSERSAP